MVFNYPQPLEVIPRGGQIKLRVDSPFPASALHFGKIRESDIYGFSCSF